MHSPSKKIERPTRRNSSRRRFLELTAMMAGGALLPGVARAHATLMGDAPVVSTGAGSLRGLLSGGTFAYLGVPYAQAPRFAAPKPARPWIGVRDAKAIANQALESDLHLNIWTPSRNEISVRPVWVWIPGGGFDNGTAGDGAVTSVESNDAVVVTVNHRAGLLGYIHLAGEQFATANHAGNLDLVAALEWVRDNIRAFGGDPGNVTLVSGAGGEGKVHCLLAMPVARGLFHRAFIGTGASGHRPGKESAAALTAAVLRELGLGESNAGALRCLPIGTLLAAAAAAKAKLPRDAPGEFRPVSDGRFLATDSASLPVLTKSSSTQRDGVNTIRQTFTWSGMPGHQVEVLMHHVVRVRKGEVVDARRLRRVAANATLAVLAQNPRA